MAGKVYGIDLGTTYSCIAQIDQYGKPVVIVNDLSLPTTPSVVYFETAENIVVGEPAKESAKIHPDRVVECVKRSMGDENYTFVCDGKSYRPEEISSLILQKLVRDAKQQTGEEVKEVVITCPAYFTLNQKEATRNAGVLAGLDVKYVIPEPTAAALAYGMEGGQDGTVLVYDLGGGTFDVTVIAIKGTEFRTICVSGDVLLGGKEWDERIVAHAIAEFAVKTGISEADFAADKESYQVLCNAAETAKKALTAKLSTKIVVGAQGQTAVVELTREKFDDLTSDLLGRTVHWTKEVVETAKAKGYDKIDKILLVGGSSYMPQVMERLKQDFSCEIALRDPHQIVAKGAALFGGHVELKRELEKIVEDFQKKEGKRVDGANPDAAIKEKAMSELAVRNSLPSERVADVVAATVVNVASQSFGLVVVNDADQEVVNNLVVVDTALPVEVTRDFGTHKENQTSAQLRAMDNLKRIGGAEDIPLAECKDVCQGVIKFTRALPKNSPIRVTFKLSPDGLLSIKGVDLTTHQEIHVEKETKAIMSNEEMKAAKESLQRLNVT